ncbi:MAG: hypothetical protein JNL12_12860 [Planctomycetes bacterium]|nr:hypothetical protein [Planctomycetota bacterium]
MFALLRKDLPWMAVFAAAGLLVALGTVLLADPVDLILFDYATAEATFWTAFGGGIGLGWFAGIFDELLGARELLQQRPLSTARLLAGKCLAVALVLVVWQVALPLAALLGWVFGSAEGLPLGAGSWLEQQASLAAAWPVAFAMLFAAHLPLHWLSRFLVGGAGVYVAMLLGDGLAEQDGKHEPSTYLGVCLVVAACFAAATMAGSGQAADRDRPVAHTMSRAGRWWFVTVVVFAASAMAIEWEAIVIQHLHGVYPQPWQQGRDVVLLAARGPDWVTRIVDAEHQPTDRQLTGGNSLSWTKRSPWLERDNEFDQPRWRTRTQSVGHVFFGGALYLLADGTLWREHVGANRQRRFERVPLPGIEALSSGAGLLDLGRQHGQALLVAPGQSRIWRVGAKGPELHEMVLPNEDRVRGARFVWSTDLQDLALRKLVAEVAGVAEKERNLVVVVAGERANYLVCDDRLLVAAGSFLDDSDIPDATDDPIEFVRTMPATAEHVAFTHEYKPSTADEHLAVFQAQMVSSLRPPVLQVLAHVLPADARPGWLFDGLVVGGRRTWLVLLQVAMAGALAWFARRYLRKLSVPTGLWTAQVVLFGLPALVVLVACESPWRLRPVEVPARPPLRIGAMPIRSA